MSILPHHLPLCLFGIKANLCAATVTVDVGAALTDGDNAPTGATDASTVDSGALAQVM